MTSDLASPGRRHGALLAIMIALFASPPAFARQRPPMTVRVEPVELRNVEETRRVTGDLRAVSRSNVATRESGLIREFEVDEGDRVHANDVLATLDNTRLTLELAYLEAQYSVASSLLEEREATYQLRKRDLEAILALRDRGASNPKELSDAQSELIIAESSRDGASLGMTVIEAQINQLNQRIADMVIRAPFDGIVIDRPTEIGEWVGEGDTVVELLSTGRYDAWLDIQEQYKPALMRSARELAISIPGIGVSFDPAPVRILPLVDPTGRNFQALVRVDDTNNELAAGMAVNAWIPTGRSGEYLLVPKDALLENATGYFVYVVRPMPQGGHASFPASVSITFDAGRHYAVRSNDLRPGDLTVVEGNEQLYPSAPVQLVNPQAAEGGRED